MKVEYHFSASIWQYPGPNGWYIVSLPLRLSKEIRHSFQSIEAGWGRLTASAKIGESEWKTAIWFDSKKNTYLLPLKAEIRNKERLEKEKTVTISVSI